MRKYIALVISIFYVFGTSTLFHVFAMWHVHTEHVSHIHHNHTNHHHPSDVAIQSYSSCGDNIDCSNICGLVEWAKVANNLWSYEFLHIWYYVYPILSPFLVNEYDIIDRYWYKDITWRKPQFSTILLGVQKLTI